LLTPVILAVLLISTFSCSQKEVVPPKPFGPIPSAAQLAWHEM
jgi:alpha-L-fucosidase